jgi:cholesterol oxidase
MARARRNDGSTLSVALLERGQEILPGEFPCDTIASAEQMQVNSSLGRVGEATALFDLRVNDDMHVLLGCGLGGTSLINANAAVTLDPRVFEDPVWPAEIRQEAAHMAAGGDEAVTPPTLPLTLADGYRYAREMLRPALYPEHYPRLRKLEVFKEMAKALGGTCVCSPINVHFGAAGPNHVGVPQSPCVGCGDCMTGCNYSAKNTVMMNYVPDAAHHGAEVFTEVLVTHVARDEDLGAWKVHYRLQKSESAGEDSAERMIVADSVILGAGSLGSTEILLRSARGGLTVSQRLGKHFTGNGDVLAFGYNLNVRINGIGTGNRGPDSRDPVGPGLTGLIDLRHTANLDDGILLEEGSIPSALALIAPEVLGASAALVGKERPIGLWQQFRHWFREFTSLVRGAYYGALANTQTLLAMSHDQSSGELRLDDDRLVVVWPSVGAEPVFERVNATLLKATESQGGIYVKDPIWSKAIGQQTVTVHPLGGCAMGDDATQGTVDHRGRVFAGSTGTEVHPGLYVLDGAVMSRSLGANPLLTISAIAERCCSWIAEERKLTINYALSAPVAPQ